MYVLTTEQNDVASPTPGVQQPNPPLTTHHSPLTVFAVIVAIIAAISLRFVALRSDPYPWLDWSAGQLTDEGFYIHNARNVALFGHATTDQFNNMLLSPWLHYIQVGVFETLGAGSVQARLISIVSSLLTIVVFFAALRRAFRYRVALTGAVFLGLDHVFLLFNRMALMDTPASLTAVAAFYAFVRALNSRGPNSKSNSSIWFTLCGALIVFTITGRTLCLFLIPAPFIGIWLGGSRGDQGCRRRAAGSVLAGILMCGMAYWALWYRPNSAEISRMNRHYRTKQIQPNSLAHLGENIYHAFLGDRRGLAPYLVRHTPIVFTLALLGLIGMRRGGRESATDKENANAKTDSQRSESIIERSSTAYLTAWLLLGWATLSVISYSPSRYYVSTYPALAAIAAFALWRLPQIWTALSRSDRATTIARTALIWFLAFHCVESVLHRGGILPASLTTLVLYSIPTAVAALAVFGASPTLPSIVYRTSYIVTLWLLVNAAWLGHWLFTLDDSQYRLSRRLAETLPANSVLLGDTAPGICLDNGFVAVNVIKGLCNGDKPIEQFAGKPRFVAMVADSPIKPKYWKKYYPDVVKPERLVLRDRAVRWDVEVYAVDEIPKEARQ